MPINVIMLILSLCGPGNNTSCRHDLTECYQQKHSEELRYGARVDERLAKRHGDCFGHGHPYPETALVYECAMDLGIPFDRPVIPAEIEAASNPEPAIEQDGPRGLVFDEDEE
jgi:hypothetical protein